MTRHRVRRRGPAAPRGGFTLVSVMIAMILLTVGVAALANANLFALRAYNAESDRWQVLQVARTHLELLRGRTPSLVGSESETRVNAADVPDGSGRFLRTTTVTAVSATLSRITVRVKLATGDLPVTVETLVYKGP